MDEEAPRRRKTASAVLAGALFAVRDVVEGKPKKEEIPIVVDAPDEPTDVDTDGIDVRLGGDAYVAPPLPPTPKGRARVRPRRRRRR